MEILATLDYINLTFILRDCDEAPKQNSPSALPIQEIPLS